MVEWCFNGIYTLWLCQNSFGLAMENCHLYHV